jgi:hypothetical protein
VFGLVSFYVKGRSGLRELWDFLPERTHSRFYCGALDFVAHTSAGRKSISNFARFVERPALGITFK